MCKKANELICKKQRPAQSQYGMLETFMINSIWLYFDDFKQCLPTDFAENLLARKNSNKSLVRDIRYRNIELWRVPLLKLRKPQRKTNYTRQNENILDSLASNITSNII